MTDRLFPPMTVGSLVIPRPVFLAPMAAYTDAAFRSLCFAHGCGAAVTEMTNAYGLMIAHRRTMRFLEIRGDEGILGAQIYGSDPSVMAEAADLVASLGRFDFLDLNAGCPMPKIRNRGDGAGLIRTPDRFLEVVSAVKRALAGRLPLTVKTRIGYEPGKPVLSALAPQLEAAGADALFVHARYALDRHSGPADWKQLAAAKEAVSIPVVGNGGIDRPGDARRMKEATGVDGVMAGRAAIANPWFFEGVEAIERGESPGGFPKAETLYNTIRDHLRREIDLFARRDPKELKHSAELTAVLAFRPHVVRYLHGFRGFKLLAAHLSELQTAEELLARVREVVAGGRKCDAPPAGKSVPSPAG